MEALKVIYFLSSLLSPSLKYPKQTMKLARVFKQSRLLCSTFSTTTITFSEESVKSLQEIPGPKGLPLLGTSLEYARHKEKAHKLLFERVKKYGKIYKEKMLSGYPMTVCVCDARDVETVFRSDGKYPLREGLPIMHKIRDKLRIPKALILRLDGCMDGQGRGSDLAERMCCRGRSEHILQISTIA